MELPPKDQVEHSILRSAVQPEAVDLATELADYGVDRLVEVLADSDVLDAIPVVKSLRAITRGAVGIREALLARNLLRFVAGVGAVPEEDAERWRNRLEDDTGEMGERVLRLVDRASAPMKAVLIGRVFRAYLDAECDRQTFLRTVEMIDRSLTEDLVALIDAPSDEADEDASATARLISIGLLVSRSHNLVLEDSKPPSTSVEGALLQRIAPRQRSGKAAP